MKRRPARAATAIARGLALHLALASATSGCNPRTEAASDAGARASRLDLEPSDAAPPPWPGWPLPAGAAVTPAVLCQAVYAPSEDLHDPCARAYDPSASMRTYLEQELRDCVVRLERSVMNGRAALDASGAERCVKHMVAVRRSGRTEIATQEHECDDAVLGRQSAGALCREEWECAPGLACAGLGPTTVGKCAVPASDGGACLGAAQRLGGGARGCAPGLWCGADRCQPRDPESALCHPGSCADGLFCSKGTNRCERALRRADETCKRGEDCDLGLYCRHSPKVPSVCKPQKRAGERCLDGLECRGDCRAGVCVSLCGSP